MPRRYSRDPAVNNSLRHSIKDGAAYAVMAGGGETYFSAFALFLKASTSQIGFLASVPPLLASFAQVFSAWLGHKTGKRKAIIIAGATLQGFVWIPIAALPLVLPQYAVELLIITVITYYACGNLAALQWSSLMGDLVEERRRGRFFARRTRISSITSFLSLVIAGLVLHYFAKLDMTMTGYLVVFSIAFVARLVSVYHLAQMYDPPGHVAVLEIPTNKNWWQQIRNAPVLRFSLFIAVIQFSVAIASPFFSVYLLRDLEFTYFQFMTCTAGSVLIQFFTLNRWGAISDLFGNRLVMTLCGMTIPAIPFLWLFSTNFYYLAFTQIISGFVWAGFSLSTCNFLYELIPTHKRATFLAIHNVMANTGTFLGAMLGGYLGYLLPRDFNLFGMDIHWASSLCNVFILSFLLRALTAALFLPRLRETRRVKSVAVFRLIFRVGRFNALSGLIFDVIGSRKKSGTPP